MRWGILAVIFWCLVPPYLAGIERGEQGTDGDVAVQRGQRWMAEMTGEEALQRGRTSLQRAADSRDAREAKWAEMMLRKSKLYLKKVRMTMPLSHPLTTIS